MNHERLPSDPSARAGDSPPDPCDRVQGRLEALWDDALPPLEAARDHGHIEACRACAAEWRALDELCGAVASARATESELAFAGEGLDARLDAAHTAAARTRTRQRLVSSALALAAGVLAMFAIHRLAADTRVREAGFPVSVQELGEWRPRFLELPLGEVPSPDHPGEEG